jgi:hypothetical protein
MYDQGSDHDLTRSLVRQAERTDDLAAQQGAQVGFSAGLNVSRRALQRWEVVRSKKSGFLCIRQLLNRMNRDRYREISMVERYDAKRSQLSSFPQSCD